MPQLDYFVLASQLNILIIFILSFLIFKYYLLPIISFFLKVENKLLIKKYKDIKEVNSYLTENKNLYENNYKILLSLSRVYKFYIDYKKKNYIVLDSVTKLNVKEHNK